MRCSGLKAQGCVVLCHGGRADVFCRARKASWGRIVHCMAFGVPLDSVGAMAGDLPPPPPRLRKHRLV